MTAGKNANPQGELSGSAGEGVAFLGASDLSALSDLFLVQIDDYHPADKGDCAKSCEPATFSGRIFIGDYRSDEQPIPQRLVPSNIRLVPAAHCPEPH